MVRKLDMKKEQWIADYEDWNVKVGLECGLAGRAQIGKGMWAKPDLMAEMVKQKIEHPKSGANCAWVPSPTAACLHAMHYHQVLVQEEQAKRKDELQTSIIGLLSVPLVVDPCWDEVAIQEELDNNAQGILGYVVRWVQDGIGCSKVLDIHNVGLMEDRATLRISSQHISNWLHHQVCTEDQVMRSMLKMAEVVDVQNQNDPSYKPMGPVYNESIAFKAACDLVLHGKDQPNGYTEIILHKKRLEYKASNFS